jgi:hypothetical protein
MIRFLKTLWHLLTDLFGCGEDPLLSQCAICGTHFVAGPDNLVEVGVEILDEADFDFEGCEMIADSDAERGFARLGIDKDGVKAIRSSAPGDQITTGAEPWCEHCLRTQFDPFVTDPES